ncbi:sorting nexin-5-like protein [Labeo rohita]|uniref:Sorting nexin-5-like protein n=1 Tax=Labeo rohita TaxID=84645 RepID=A0A498L697_LABRO|nr:sorting nexin-5-like protein [Labeo rohita]
MMEDSNEEAALSVSASSIRITDVTEDGDVLTFAITSQKLNSSAGVCVFRTYDDFDWLQQSLFSQENLPGLQGIISPGKQRGRKGIFNRLSQAVEEMRKESHKDVDNFFQNERNKNTNVAALSKVATEKLLDVVMTEQKLALACGHFSTSLHLCVNQDDADAVAFSKICLKLSDIIEAVKRNFEKVASNNMSTLGLGLDLESRYQEAEKEMLFRRTCKLIELETVKKNTEKAKANKREVMEAFQKAVEKEFNQTSSVAKQEKIKKQLRKNST